MDGSRFQNTIGLPGAAGFLQKLRSMVIVRPNQCWCVVLPTRAERLCLQRLALKHGYRIGELCAELECSERYLYSVFTRDIGLPPKEWMRWERMVVARRKLTGGKSPPEVAADLGFSSQNNFRREFVATYRMSPSQYQQASRGEGGHGGCAEAFRTMQSPTLYLAESVVGNSRPCD